MEEEATNNASSLIRNNPSNFSFKDQKKTYELKKRYFTKNIQCAIDSTQEVHSGWLKARISFKRWIKVWCQIKPGYLIMYTSQEAQKKHRLGVVLLSICQVMRRPTKKEGFCFKLINPFGCSVWAKSSTKAIAFSQASLTLRASDSSVGKLWLGALHRCNLSSQLDGYQPEIDETFDEILSNRSELSDNDDGDESTRNIGSMMLNNSNSTSNNNSISSKNINCQSFPNTSSIKPLVNGNVPTINNNHLKDSTSAKFGINNLAYKLDDHDNNRVNNKNRVLDNSSSHIGNNNSFINNNINNNNNNNYITKRNTNKNINDETTKTRLNQNQVTSTVYQDKIVSSSSKNCTKMVAKFSKYNWIELQLENVKYIMDGLEEFGSVGVQSEDVHEGNKSILWHIIKQLRPGMDLSKVTLPAFILEPRSFLEKLADYYYHCDILSDAVSIDDPLLRLINIVKWYLSGFYKKPKGSKKPYNPILGEKFRCFWDQPKTQSRTFFIAEQVSHHPPISAFHVSNRKDGYTITCAILSRSKYGGNSVSAIFDGKAHLFLTKRNETYTLSLPYANCRGILLGSLCLELGGKVEISCAETNCKCELDFKLAPVWANSNSYNAITGKILRANKVTHTLDGHWDKKIQIVDVKTNDKSVLWEVNDTIRNSRLKRYTVALRDQADRESVKLWSKVSEALMANDYVAATTEKTALEDMQRQEARDRKNNHAPEHFVYDIDKREWRYRWQDDRIWNENRDIMQFEDNFKIKTLILGTPTQNTSSSSSSLAANLHSKTSPHQQSIAITNYDPTIDLPLTQVSKFSDSVGEINNNNNNNMENVKESKNQPTTSSQASSSLVNNQLDKLQLDPEKFKSFVSNFNIMSQDIRKVTEANKKLEVEVATLKRGKKTAALIMAAIIVAFLSWYFKYFS